MGAFSAVADGEGDWEDEEEEEEEVGGIGNNGRFKYLDPMRRRSSLASMKRRLRRGSHVFLWGVRVEKETQGEFVCWYGLRYVMFRTRNCIEVSHKLLTTIPSDEFAGFSRTLFATSEKARNAWWEALRSAADHVSFEEKYELLNVIGTGR